MVFREYKDGVLIQAISDSAIDWLWRLPEENHVFCSIAAYLRSKKHLESCEKERCNYVVLHGKKYGISMNKKSYIYFTEVFNMLYECEMNKQKRSNCAGARKGKNV